MSSTAMPVYGAGGRCFDGIYWCGRRLFTRACIGSIREIATAHGDGHIAGGDRLQLCGGFCQPLRRSAAAMDLGVVVCRDRSPWGAGGRQTGQAFARDAIATRIRVDGRRDRRFCLMAELGVIPSEAGIHWTGLMAPV